MAGLSPAAPMENALSERMNAGESKGKPPAPGQGEFWVYILECADGTLYVGSTTDVDCRLQRHNAGTGARHTGVRGPSQVVYSESHPTLAAARRREAQLKRWSHAKKQALVDEHLDRLHRLARRRHY